MLLEYLQDNIVLIIPNSIKNSVLKQINELNTIYNIKIMSKEELLNGLTLSYDERAIYYLVNKYHYKYDIALMYLNNLKYVNDKDYDDPKIAKLVELKSELQSNNLFNTNELLVNSLKNKKIIIYGYAYLTKYEKEVLKDYNYLFVEDQINNYKHTIYEFKTIDEEVEYVAYKIAELINKGIDINNIKIANINEEYYIPLKRIFVFYNIPFEDVNRSSIYATKIVQDFLNTLDINSLDYDFEEKNNAYILEQIVRVINKYNFVSNLEDIKEILETEFKNIKNKTIKQAKEIEFVSLFNSIFTDNNYVFFMNFNQGYAPAIVKDEDYLSDKEKELLGLENKYELNKINKEVLIKKINSIKNMEITYKLKSESSIFEPSFLADDLGYEVISNPDIGYNYSHKMNEIKLSLMLDDLVKYQNQNNDLVKLFSSYKNIPYYAYDNKFKGILKDDFINYVDHKLSLSYSSIDNYYKCAFRYYLTNILKIDNSEDKFVTKIGNIFHKVLEDVFKNNTPFEDSFNKTITEYELNAKEEMFIAKLKSDLEFIITTINKQNSYSSLDNTLCEERVFVNKDRDIKLTFTGVIDKLMYKEKDGYNYVVIIDYKTGNPDINLNNVYYGINMQLPIYVYLVNHKIKNVKIIGFYLQKILHSKPKKDNKKDIIKLKEDALKLEGYTNSNIDYVSLFDSNLDSSEVIKGFKTTKSGSIDSKAHTLSDKDINKLIKITDEKVDEAFTRILDREFTINPKIIDNENIGCKYCKYQDICFKKEENNIYLDKKDYKEFLKEGD